MIKLHSLEKIRTLEEALGSNKKIYEYNGEMFVLKDVHRP